MKKLFYLALLVAPLAIASPAAAAGVVTTCSEAALDTALSGGGSVTFNTGSACTITVTSTKTISADTTIDGVNGGTGTTLSGGGSVRIFTVNSSKIFTLNRLTLTGGNSATTGGAINNSGTLTVTNSVFSANAAGTRGGGIWNTGTATVANSTFNANTANDYGGGFFTQTGTAAITNSTFYANTCGIAGGGINRSSGTLTLTNTLLNGNIGSGVANDCAGIIVNGGNNIENSASCGWGSALGSMTSTDPKLNALANNGGPTQTISLQAGSPAINAGNQSVCAASPINNKDQRGYYRPGRGAAACSIGAYEANSGPLYQKNQFFGGFLRLR